MKKRSLYLAGMMLSFILFLAPHHAQALGLSFGGRIIFTDYECLNAAVFITIIPAGGDQNTDYIWTPDTVTYSAGSFTEGGQALGVADLPAECVLDYETDTSLPGQRMQMVGTSLE